MLLEQLLTANTFDYGKLGFMAGMLAFGSVLNLLVIWKLSRYLRSSSARLFLLQINLCICDFTISMVYTANQIGTQLTSDYQGGQVLCKLVKFVEFLSIYLSSNTVACVSLNRAIAVISPTALSRQNCQKRVRWMVLWSWLIAFICSFPQFFMWAVTNQELIGHNFTYCSHAALDPNLAKSELHKPIWMFYSLSTVVVNFWLPLLVILISYAIVVCKARPCRLAARELDSSQLSSGKLSKTSSLITNNRPRKTLVSAKRVTFAESSVILANEEQIFARNLRTLAGRLKSINLLLTLSYIFTWLPYNILIFWSLSNEPLGDVTEISAWLGELFLLRSVIDPLIWIIVGFRCV